MQQQEISESGRWEERYTAGYDQDGKRINKNVPGRPQADVRAKLSVATAESQQLDVSRSGEYMVAAWPRLWFEFYAKPGIRPSAAGYCRCGIKQHTVPQFGIVKLNKLTSREIQGLYKDLLENGRTREPPDHGPPQGGELRPADLHPSEAVGRLVRECAKHPDPAAILHQRVPKDAGLEHIRFRDLRHAGAL